MSGGEKCISQEEKCSSRPKKLIYSQFSAQEIDLFQLLAPRNAFRVPRNAFLAKKLIYSHFLPQEMHYLPQEIDLFPFLAPRN